MKTGRSIPKRLAFLLRPGWIAVILAALAFAGACFFVLAPWQFGRNSERSAQNAAIAAALAATAVPVFDLMSTDSAPPGSALWHVVTATGTFDPSRQVLVRLRQNSAGQPISEVVLPFRLTTGETLLVDRGSVSFLEVNRGTSIPAAPAGEVTITGRVQDDQLDPSNRPPTSDHGQVQVTEISANMIDEAFGARPGETFVNGFVQLTGQSPGVLTPIELPQTDPGPFLSYALQWELFGAVALIGLGVFIVREFRDPRTDSDDAPGSSKATEPQPVPAGRERRRRSRDGFDRAQLWDDVS